MAVSLAFAPRGFRPDAGASSDAAAPLERLRRECLALARRRAGLSALTAFVPLPGVDLVTDVAVLRRLIDDITRRFGLDEGQLIRFSPQKTALAYQMLQKSGGFMAARLSFFHFFLALLRRAGWRLGVMEGLRLAPVVGQIAAAGIAYFTLTWIARRHIDQCARIAGQLDGVKNAPWPARL